MTFYVKEVLDGSASAVIQLCPLLDFEIFFIDYVISMLACFSCLYVASGFENLY